MHFHLKPLSALLPLTLFMIVVNQDLNAQATGTETFTVTQVPAENGSYTIQPAIADATRVKAGTVLTVIAKPSPKFRLDAIYYTVKGGM